MKTMHNIIVASIATTILLLAACQSSALSISELQHVPSNIQAVINADSTLQMITNEERSSYIIFHSTEAAAVEFEVSDHVLNINFNTTAHANNGLKQYVYQLKRGDSEHDTIRVLINGQETHFDGGVTIF